MRHVNCLHMMCIESLSHIRRVFDHTVQLSMSFCSLINYVSRYVFIIRNMCSWADVDLYLFRRFASIYKNRLLFENVFFISKFKISSVSFSTDSWWDESMIVRVSTRNKDDDEIDWNRRDWSCRILDFCILLIMINILIDDSFIRHDVIVF